MKGLRGTEFNIPLHPLYTPLVPSTGGMDKKMEHWVGLKPTPLTVWVSTLTI